MLDFVGNSERFNEGYVPATEPLDSELEGSHYGRGGTFVPTVEATDSWIWREWMDVEPGGEAVDLVVGISKAPSLDVSAGPSRKGSLFTSAGYRTLEAG